jgi:hypothetical protein
MSHKQISCITDGTSVTVLAHRVVDSKRSTGSLKPSKGTSVPFSTQVTLAQAKIESREQVLKREICVDPSKRKVAAMKSAVQSNQSLAALNDTRRQRLRPSLSEQLLMISRNAESITENIKRTHGLGLEIDPKRNRATTIATHSGSSNSSSGAPICTFPAMSFVVGKLECRYPSPVAFFSVSVHIT